MTTPRERWIKVLNGEKLDRVPCDFWSTSEGMERAMEDLVLNPGIVEAALDQLFWIHESIFRRTLDEIGDRIQLMEVSEDLGQQKSLLMSPEAFRKFLKPNMERMTEIVHSYGVKVLHHDDGAIRPIIPDLIDIGIDVLNPIQWRCNGMEREGLARDFGTDLVFHGGIDVQQTLPLGTPQDVRDEVAENIRIFRNSRGYILTSCHRIQTDVPTENILAMYEAVEEFGEIE